MVTLFILFYAGNKEGVYRLITIYLKFPISPMKYADLISDSI